MPRPLTTIETASFLLRHPFVSARIAETEAFMKIGQYDWGWEWWPKVVVPGVIPPWGLQVQDSEFNLVTVFPTKATGWRYTGFSPVLGDINKPPYESQPEPFSFVPLAGLGVIAALGLGIAAGWFGGRK